MFFGITEWGIENNLIRLPGASGDIQINIDERQNTVCLDVSRTDIDMVPQGLKGVDLVILKKSHGPIFVAPDFKGAIGIYERDEDKEKRTAVSETSGLSYSMLLDPSVLNMNLRYLCDNEIKKAQNQYIKYQCFVEAPRYLKRIYALGNTSDFYNSGCILPNNMRFYQNNGRMHLDLSHTGIFVVPGIKGIGKRDIIMPPHPVIRRKRIRIPQQNQNIKE